MGKRGKKMEVEGEGEERNPSSNGEAEHRHGLKDKNEEKEKEGSFLLGSPTFVEIGNGRFRCVETGHELLARDKDSYARSKACRLALIDAAIVQKKPPLNMFQPHPLSKSQLVCKMTGDTVNKTEEHIWKHINGRRFQNKLEQKEVEKLASAEVVEKDAKQSKKSSKSSTKATKRDQKKKDGENAPPTRKSNANNSDSEEPDFWVPPIGSRWDFDDGRDRWESCTSSSLETGDGTGLDKVKEKDDPESGELTMQTKRMSIAVGPSSFASRKKKIKKASANPQNDN
ncbi:uncharacterized protein [Elaeis guineensis]|uniref:Surfeit locus protein 2 isoform X1 n=1 Tax=Elaeis guineensis var. tenera TaxID=51953 RepID=A0A6I9RNL3_ELAGV|nr:surfeit locus protein 2 isoform X1 [Elaeis guineensis]